MAEEFDLFLDSVEIYGDDDNCLNSDWDFQDEFIAANPITNVEMFSRCSTPMPNELIPTLPISSWLFVQKGYEEFKNALKRLPDCVKVRGVKCPPKYMINGNLVSSRRIRRLKEPTFKELMQYNGEELGAYVQSKHPKCQKKHSFNDKKKLSPISRTVLCNRLPYEESELNNVDHHSPSNSLPAIPTHTFHPSVLDLPNYSDLINDENTPSFDQEAFRAMEYEEDTSANQSESLQISNWSSGETDTASISISGDSDELRF